MTATLERDEAHVYRFGGAIVPGVTSILRPLIDLSGIPRDVLEAKRDLGQRVHAACHYLSENDLDEASVEEDVRPYLAGFEKFLRETGATLIANERMVYSKQWGYAGQLDAIILLNGEKVLLDFKTSIVLPASASAQTAAYLRALDDPSVTRRAALRLRADGTYRLDMLYGADDFAVFLACLTLHHWKARNKP